MARNPNSRSQQLIVRRRTRRNVARRRMANVSAVNADALVVAEAEQVAEAAAAEVAANSVSSATYDADLAAVIARLDELEDPPPDTQPT